MINGDRGDDVGTRVIINNMNVLQFVAHEKVLEEAVIILLVFIIITINPAQAHQ